ncbi:hypothetical protein J8L88_14960 [Aquimarina sp. MMG015]|uniref:hypothetical protein n=1 Tax=Aquimarina sp. MMG015 TaxID=2822689 RepID=UPI001B3A234B|nr:hypothetical protein [Aquimarina sp. MMG015]MBQ4804161.1 hypothetical protein [Aquimarina sp. MMG015]
MEQKEFEFKAFIIENYYKMWLVFAVLLLIIIVVPGFLLADYFLPENTANTSLISQLLVLAMIGIPLMILLFTIINGIFFKKLHISLGKGIKIKRNKKVLYQLNKDEITKFIIKSNDDKTLQNRFRTLEINTNQDKKIKIISRDKNQEGVFNDFLKAYILYYNLNKDHAQKVSINTLGDYKLIFDLKN